MSWRRSATRESRAPKEKFLGVSAAQTARQQAVVIGEEQATFWTRMRICVSARAFGDETVFFFLGRTSSSAGHASSGLCLGPPMNQHDNGKRSSLGPNLLAKLIQLGDNSVRHIPPRRSYSARRKREYRTRPRKENRTVQNQTTIRPGKENQRRK